MYESTADVTVGETHRFGSYDVTPEEVREFATQYDPQPFHLDDEAAAETGFEGIIASGWHTAAMTERLLVDNVLADSEGLGSPGVDELRWRRPVRPGDTLSVEFTVEAVEDWDEDRGLLRAALTTLNQDDEAVMTMAVLILLPRE